MTTQAREIRDDQHGTITGYVYGCRCPECAQARRDYVAQREADGKPKVGSESIEAVYRALEHEADLDGIVTATRERLGELADLNTTSIGWAIQHLAEAKRIKLVGRHNHGVLEIHRAGAA